MLKVNQNHHTVMVVSSMLDILERVSYKVLISVFCGFFFASAINHAWWYAFESTVFCVLIYFIMSFSKKIDEIN